MNKMSWFKIVLMIVVVAAIVLAAKYGLSKYKGEVKTTNSNSYYAVFLTSNQVYFGHLSNVNDSFINLKNIFYLQVAKPLQSTTGETLDNPLDTEQSKLTLIKLGKEVHGPKDEMQINRDNVLFYEELKDDSKVVQTIKNTK